VLADMIDRATYRQIHTAVDRWYVVNVMNEERGNVSRVARRLRVSRKRVRVLWARLRSTAGKDDARKSRGPGKPSNAPPPPALEPLLPKGTYREVHDTVDRWLLGHTLTRVDGNVSQAARDLAVSRKHLRDHLARVNLHVK
jgi:DNA-binding NtrC family response regulator